MPEMDDFHTEEEWRKELEVDVAENFPSKEEEAGLPACDFEELLAEL